MHIQLMHIQHKQLRLASRLRKSRSCLINVLKGFQISTNTRNKYVNKFRKRSIFKPKPSKKQTKKTDVKTR